MDFEQGFLVAEAIEVLEGLPKRDQIFAAKMVKFYDHNGRLSPKQMAVLEDILTRNRCLFATVDNCLDQSRIDLLVRFN
jgi:hypothetical protein